MIEHVFEGCLPKSSSRSSVLEETLRAHLDNSRPLLLTVAQPVGGPLFDVDLTVVGGHGGRRSADLGAETDADERRLGAFREVLEAGSRYLTGAARAQLEQRRLAAVQARGLAEFARHRPSSMLDRPDDEVGAAAAASRAARPTALTEVSEWAVDEVMAELGLSSQAAAVLLTQSVTLVEQLPATLRSLEQGVISWAHATMLVEVLEPLSDPDKRAEVEAKLLARAANKTVPQLRAAARRAVLRADASAATRRLAKAIRQRQVRAHTGKDGVGSLTADGLPVPVVLACRKALEEYAKDAQSRTIRAPWTADRRLPGRPGAAPRRQPSLGHREPDRGR
jgi:hypothetical protein